MWKCLLLEIMSLLYNFLYKISSIRQRLPYDAQFSICHLHSAVCLPAFQHDQENMFF